MAEGSSGRRGPAGHRPSAARKDGEVSPSRRRNEEAILDAFERVVAKVGFRGVGPTAIMNEAGLGKPLLYRYFGDLPGLIEAWGRRRGMWPGKEVFLGAERGDTDPKHQLKEALDVMATFLHRNPVRLEVLAEELTPATEISAAVAAVRRGSTGKHEELFPPDHPQRQRENFRLNFVLSAALVYFALRSRTSPELQGVKLDTDQGWEDALNMIHEIIDDAILASLCRRMLDLVEKKP